MIKFFSLVHYLIITELTIFFLCYFCGSSGHKVVKQLEEQNIKLKNRIGLLQNNIINLQRDLDNWENESFYKEKFAREFLQMANEKDKIYV